MIKNERNQYGSKKSSYFSIIGIIKLSIIIFGIIFGFNIGGNNVWAINWDNNNFIDQTFWEQSPTDQDIKDAFFGVNANDSTAYTNTWSNWNYNKCSNVNVIETDTLPANLTANTIYVLNTDSVSINGAIKMGICNVIVSKIEGGTTITATSTVNEGVIQSAYQDGSVTNIIIGKRESESNQALNIIDNISINGGNSTYGFYVNGIYTTVNNVRIYNTQNGIYMTNSTPSGCWWGTTYGYGTINNVIVFNNNSYGIYIDGLQYITLNSIQTFNNENGINLNGCSNMTSNNIAAYNNSTNGLQGIDTSDSILNYNNGTNNDYISWDYVTNPVDGDGNYLLDWSISISNQKGPQNFAGPAKKYSFGREILDTNGYFVGSTMQKATGSLEIPGIVIEQNNVVTGISDDSFISSYSIFRDVDSPSIGNAINDGTNITLTQGEGEKDLILQLWGDHNFATHFEIPTFRMGYLPPECTISYSITNNTNQDVTATISCDQEGVVATNNNGNNTYTFTQNGSFTFEMLNQLGLTGSFTANVTWIDKVPPTCEIRETTNGNNNRRTTTATLVNCSKPITVTNNGGSTSYTFQRNATETSFTFEFVDAYGNTGTASAYTQNQCSNNQTNTYNGVINVCNIARQCTLGNNNTTLTCENKTPKITEIEGGVAGKYPNLTTLNLKGNQISDFEFFKGLDNINYLDLSNNNLSDIYWMGNLSNPTTLILNDNQISNISILGNLSNLQSLQLGNNNISDINSLGNLSNLSTLYLNNNQISNISTLGELNNLRDIKLDNNLLSDISYLSNLSNTNTITLNNNQIFDITSILNLTNLSNITLGYNCIDWTGLENELQTKLTNIGAGIGSQNYGEQFLCRNENIEYNPSTPTSGDVIASLVIYGDQTKKALLNESDRKHTFIENGSFDFNLDFAGDFIDTKEGTITAKVNWIDKIPPTCDINYSTQALTSGNVIASLTGCSEEIILTNNEGQTYFEFTGNNTFTFEYSDLVGNTGETIATVNWIDKEGPTFDFFDGSGYECKDASIRINNLLDNFELDTNPISFDGINRDNVNTYDMPQEKGNSIKHITGYVMDKVGNISVKVASFSFIDTGITADNFSVEGVGSGKSANWLLESNANEGDCGNKYIIADIKSQGNSGSCTLSGKEITYTPDENVVGNDSCTLTLQDFEGNTTDVVISWQGVNNLGNLKSSIKYSPNSGNRTSGDVVANIIFNFSGVIITNNEGNDEFIFTGNRSFTFEYSWNGITGENTATVDWIDKQAPNFTIESGTVYECTTGTFEILSANDSQSGLPANAFSLDGISRGSTTTFNFMKNKPATISASGYVRDNAGNIGIKNTLIYVLDSEPTANNFSGNINSGDITQFNWKILSNATEGACGAGNLEAIVLSGGRHGECSISGDFLIYSGSRYDDACIISIFDDENNIVDITVELFSLGSIEIQTPTTLSLTGTIRSRGSTQIVTGKFENEYFAVSDTIGDDNGWYTTISATNLIGKNNTINKSNIYIKSAGLEKLTGVDNENVKISTGLSDYVPLSNPATYIYRNTNSNNGKKGTYGDSPDIKITVPAFTQSDNYHAQLIFTIYEN